MWKKLLIYLFTAAAIFSLIFLGVTYWLLQTTWSNGIFANNGLRGQDVANTSSVIFNDPLITTVPADQQSSEQKTKVFVSSLDPAQGNSTSAKVFVILYGNLLDSDMQAYLQVLPDVVKKYSADNVAFVWKDYATSAAEEQAAIVGHCAHEQHKFWEYAEAVPDRTGDDVAALVAVASGVGTSAPDIQDCVATAGYSAQVQQSRYAGQVLGVNSGHTLFINDHSYSDPITVDQITQTIDETLASFQ